MNNRKLVLTLLFLFLLIKNSYQEIFENHKISNLNFNTSSNKLKFDVADGTTYNLNLTKTDRKVINKDTMIWMGEDFNQTYKTLNPTPIFDYFFVKNIEHAEIYYDFSNYAALIHHIDNGVDVWEGYIGTSVLRYYEDDEQVLSRIADNNNKNSSTDSNGHKNNIFLDPATFNLNLGSEDLNLKLLIIFDKKITDQNNARNIIYHVLYFTAVDMIFSKFSSPHIKLNIVGFIIPNDSKDVFNNDEGSRKLFDEKEIIFTDNNYKQNFTDKSYDIVFSISSENLFDDNNEFKHTDIWLEVNTKNSNWTNLPIKSTKNPVFKYPNTLVGYLLGFNYLNAAQRVAEVIRNRLIPKFPFSIVPKIINKIDQSVNVWSYNDQTTTTKSPVIPIETSTQTPKINSTDAPRITSTEAPRITSTETPKIISTEAPRITPTETPKITSTEAPKEFQAQTDDASYSSSNAILIGSIVLVTLVIVLIASLIGMYYSKFRVIWYLQHNKKEKSKLEPESISESQEVFI